jgi:hypothetical protein
MAQIGRFTFTQLKEPESFRVLYIEPAASGPVRFILKHVLFADNPKYVAVSYTWDEQPFDHEVICAGNSFAITKNCHDILSTLRHEELETPVWIDQICIDQASEDDKSANITQMGKIFQSSTAVLVWTGLWDEDMSDHLSKYVLYIEEAPMVKDFVWRMANPDEPKKRYIGPLFRWPDNGERPLTTPSLAITHVNNHSPT